MKHSTTLLAVLAIALSAFPAASEELKKGAQLCAPFYDEVISKGKAARTSDSGACVLLPSLPAADPIRTAIAADKPGILVETLFFLPREASSDPEAQRAELARIYGLLRSFSTLEGIQYYSVTHGGMRTLYAESYRIDGPSTKRRLADPEFPLPSAMPSEETLFAFQRDLSFGANVYSYVFNFYGDSIGTEMTNLTRMSYGIIPVVSPQGLKTRLLIAPASDGILFYAESDSGSAGIFRSKLSDSFANRATALFAWFKDKSSIFIAP